MKKGLLIRESEPNKYCADFSHLYGDFVKITDEDKIRNYCNDHFCKPTEYYDNLTVSSQMDDNSDHAYGFSIHYREFGTVTLMVAEKLVKTLRSITKKMDKLETQGYSDFGEYVVRASKACNISYVIFEQHHRGSTYDDNEYLFVEPKYARIMINDWVAKIIKKRKGE